MPNPSFEEYDTCPDNLSQLNKATHWFYISDGTSDYFNSCETVVPLSVSVPQNFAGHQLAHTGNAYSGLLFTAGDTIVNGSHFQWIEYLGVRLKEPMKNVLYKVSFYISLADSMGNTSTTTHTSSQSLNIFNCAFLPNQIYETGTSILSIEPDFEVDFIQPVTDSLGWTKVEGYVYGQEGDEYMMIGQLNKDYNQYVSHKYDYSAGYRIIQTYYDYDDVEVIPVSEGSFPNIFTPNGDDINDEFDLKINCSNCGLQLQVFNRWGQLLTTTDQLKWDGTFNGNMCSDGTYYYLLIDTVNIKSVFSGFFQLQKN